MFLPILAVLEPEKTYDPIGDARGCMGIRIHPLFDVMEFVLNSMGYSSAAHTS